jgi:hypothetical protein
MRRLFVGVVGVVLTGCAATPPAPAEPTGPRQCDASAARSLIGSHVGAVDFAAGSNVRIVCTTCATTRDYRPDRLNIRFDQQTGIIEKVDCG